MSDGGGGGGDKGGGDSGGFSKGGGDTSGNPSGAPTFGGGGGGGGEAPGLPGVSAGGGTPITGGGGTNTLGGGGGGDTLGQTGAIPDFSGGSFTGGGSSGSFGGGDTSATAQSTGAFASPGTNVLTGAPGAGAGPAAGPAPGSLDFTSLGSVPPLDLSSRIQGGGGSNTQTGSGGSDILSSLGVKNPLGAAIGLGGLGYAVSQGQQTPKYAQNLEQQAAALNSQGQQLLSYLNSGTLPPGLKASLDQATSAAKAKIVSNFAAQGLNTDPTQNSVLQQELAAVDQQSLISTAQIGQQLLSSGYQEAGLSSDLYKTLANIDQTQTAAIGKSIANFAAALSGTGGGINIKLPGQS